MNPIDDVLLAVTASHAGDTSEAQRHLQVARQRTQTAARRLRQLVEIAGLVVTGAHERAVGLALVHAAEFSADSAVLDRITGRGAEPMSTDPVARPQQADGLYESTPISMQDALG